VLPIYRARHVSAAYDVYSKGAEDRPMRKEDEGPASALNTEIISSRRTPPLSHELRSIKITSRL
jgi:hypothetical protein